MHANHFDRLTRNWVTIGTRRHLLRVLLGAPLGGLLAAWRGETEAGRRQVRRRSRRDADKGRGDNQGKANKGIDTSKKEKKTCARAGKAPKKGKRCCQGLVKNGTGRCAARPPDPAACATTCAGCCAGETCMTRRTNTLCGTGGQPCAPCSFPQTCGGGAVPGVCGCTPTACPSDFCGDIENRCGGTISCNTCAPCANREECGPHHLCRNGQCVRCHVCNGPVPCQTTVQAAIDQAQPGGTIYVCPGAYNETLVITKKLTLIGAGSGANAGDTILDADGTGRVVSIGKGIDVHLAGLRIVRGDPSGEDPGPVGGGIYNDTGSLSLTGCVVAQNNASHGGGIYNVDGIVSITTSDVHGNIADGSGGGIYNRFGTITLGNGAIVTDNQAANPPLAGGSGGGIFNDLGQVTRETGSSVTLNRPDDCIDVGGPTACGCEDPCP